MTREEAIAELQRIAKSDDIEVAHSHADLVLCELLNTLGYQDVTDAWDYIEKWYA